MNSTRQFIVSKADKPVIHPAAPPQSAILFCLEPETFGIFMEWLKGEHSERPPDWFDAEEVRSDLAESLLWLADILELHGAK